ncbi:MAG: hypothetical protein OJF47_004193 [Nitrospira sp.]|jgi:hypothetical protein|nr:MAG: hypothetical protein OJF47_004193 [Nitrospira sp.]
MNGEHCAGAVNVRETETSYRFEDAGLARGEIKGIYVALAVVGSAGLALSVMSDARGYARFPSKGGRRFTVHDGSAREGRQSMFLKEVGMDCDKEVETAVLRYMQQHLICPMEELFRNLPDCTVNQKFLTVDRLSREGKVMLRYQNRSEYVIVQSRGAREWLPEVSGTAAGGRM